MKWYEALSLLIGIIALIVTIWHIWFRGNANDNNNL